MMKNIETQPFGIVHMSAFKLKKAFRTLVYILIRKNMNDWKYNAKDIARQTQQTERNVYRHLRELVSLGILNHDGNMYTLIQEGLSLYLSTDKMSVEPTDKMSVEPTDKMSVEPLTKCHTTNKSSTIKSNSTIKSTEEVLSNRSIIGQEYKKSRNGDIIFSDERSEVGCVSSSSFQMSETLPVLENRNIETVADERSEVGCVSSSSFQLAEGDGPSFFNRSMNTPAADTHAILGTHAMPPYYVILFQGREAAESAWISEQRYLSELKS